jgi:hypothetical protein
MNPKLTLRARMPIRPVLKIEEDLGTRDLTKPEFGWLLTAGPWYLCKFRDGAREIVPIETLARFDADGAYDLEWLVPKPPGFENDVNKLKPTLLLRFKDFYRSARHKSDQLAK